MMNDKEIRRQLRLIADARQLTQEDKDFILAQCQRFGIAPPDRPRCKNCWQDRAIECWAMMRCSDEEQRRFVLREGVDIRFGDVRVCEATLTDELAAELIKKGLSKKFFTKCD